MITRALFLSLGWFIPSFIAVLVRGRRHKENNFFFSLLWLCLVLGAGGLWAYLTFGVPREIDVLGIIALLNGIFWIWKLRGWSSLGQVAWSMTLLTTIIFILYSFSVTAFTPLNPLSFLLAIVFFFVEATALLLGLTHAYESLEVITRVRWQRRVPPYMPTPDYLPKVSLQIPTYNEPPEVVEQTLYSLARLDYPNFEVLVVDNNTPDESNWRALEAICRRMGPRFRLLHLERWPGFKSGALNFALTQTAPDAEIIAVVDADYQIDPNFLKEIVPAFRDPQVAFVQTPQDYRDPQLNSFAETIYHGYKYFFEVSMPVRNEHNAIIFCGTMGLIRRHVLEEIGGWDEWCITEDAEASLRILKRGYDSIYIHKTYGRGLMPFTFEGLKKQRFRWGFGGIQILRKHWESLMPWAKSVDPTNRLTAAQRYYYLVGGLQWFTDVFNLMFSFFLVLGAIFSIFSTRVSIRPLTVPLMVVPAVFLLLNTWRFLWVLRNRLKLSLGKAARAMFGFFSLSWVVTLASFQGLVQPRGTFLRTPKSQTDSKAIQAIQATLWEAGLGALCAAAGLVAFIERPAVNTAFLAVLLAWQSSLFLSAPVLSLMSAYGRQSPPSLQPTIPIETGVPVGESRAARWALAMAMVALLVYAVAHFAAPLARIPAYAQLQPGDIPVQRLVQQVPLNQRGNLPTPVNSGGTSGGPSVKQTATPTAKPTAGKPTSTPTPTATGVPPVVAPTTAPTASPIPLLPTATPLPSPTSTQILIPPTPTLPAAPTPAPTNPVLPIVSPTRAGPAAPTPTPTFTPTPTP